MRVISRRRLREFWELPGRKDSLGPLKAWLAEAADAHWQAPADIKERYPRASILGDNRVVFDIGGNKYRLVVHVNYEIGFVLIKFIGTHAEYDRIDAEYVGGGG
jgi:mRNA interferase HigB